VNFILEVKLSHYELLVNSSINTDRSCTSDEQQLDTHQLLQDLEKMTLTNEKLFVSQMSLMINDDCNSQMAIEYCSSKLSSTDQYQIEAKKVRRRATPMTMLSLSSDCLDSE
jgi:hypothetical protein